MSEELSAGFLQRGNKGKFAKRGAPENEQKRRSPKLDETKLPVFCGVF